MTSLITQKQNCIICNSKALTPYLNLGKTALANSYLKKVDLRSSEELYPLRVSYCHDCHCCQLTDIIERKSLFENYAYFASASLPLYEHFRQYADTIYERFPEQTKQFTLEIASSDGILLEHFKKFGGPILGVDPALNIALTARKRGIDTLSAFFNLGTAQQILKKYKRPGVITANHVLAHTDNPHDIIAGVKLLLDQQGVFVFEVQYIAHLLRKKEFDLTYHEHICYFSLHPLMVLLEQHGLQIFDVEHIDREGGSLRVYAAHAPSVFSINPSVKKLLQQEQQWGLHDFQTYKNFSKVPEEIKDDLLTLLYRLKQQNKKIAGYGAPAKGNTLLQYCGISSKLIDYIIDTTPFKQGKFTPGSHILIYDPIHLKKDLPDYILILTWNFAETIIKNESWLTDLGVRFIKPVPKVTII